MHDDYSRILFETVRRLLRRNAVNVIQKIVEKTHAADLSVILSDLQRPDRLKFLSMITDTGKKGLLLTKLDADTFQDIVRGMKTDDIVEILETMQTDDAADLLRIMPEEMSDTMSVAALVGSTVPMFFARMSIDPAVATGPFVVTTSIDIVSIFFYFKIATVLLAL